MALVSELASGVAVGTASDLSHSYLNLYLAGLKRDSEYAANYQNPNIVPTPGDILQAWYQGIISDDLAANSLRQYGIYAVKEAEDISKRQSSGHYLQLSTLWDAVLASKKPIMNVTEALTLFNRGVMNERDLRWHFKHAGYKDKGYQNWLMEFAKEIPGPSDIVMFTVKSGFEPSVQRQLRLNEEFPPAAYEWLSRQGLGYPFKVRDPYTNEVADTNWAQVYWATHWQNISPSQAYEAVQRLRPNRVEKYKELTPNVQPFTMDDVNLWLRINDYPPSVRDTLAALSYRVLTRVDARRLYARGIIDKAELSETYQDMGYTPVDARRLADFAEFEKQNAKKKTARVLTLAKVQALYLDGVLRDEDARIQLYRLCVNDDQKLAAFDAMPAGAQADTAFKDSCVKTQFGTLLLERHHSKLKRLVAAYKRAFLQGRIPADKVNANLLAVGLQAWKVQDLLDEWQLLLTTKQKELTTAQVISLFKDRIITLDVAAFRLRNLGYEVDDVDALLKKAQAEALAAQEKALAAQGRADARARKQLAQQQAKEQQKGMEGGQGGKGGRGKK